MSARSLAAAQAKAKQFDKEREQIERLTRRLELLREKNRRTYSDIFKRLPEGYGVCVDPRGEGPTEINAPPNEGMTDD